MREGYRINQRAVRRSHAALIDAVDGCAIVRDLRRLSLGTDDALSRPGWLGRNPVEHFREAGRIVARNARSLWQPESGNGIDTRTSRTTHSAVSSAGCDMNFSGRRRWPLLRPMWHVCGASIVRRRNVCLISWLHMGTCRRLRTASIRVEVVRTCGAHASACASKRICHRSQTAVIESGRGRPYVPLLSDMLLSRPCDIGADLQVGPLRYFTRFS